MKKRFRFEDYRGDYVMHCETEDEAIAFCKFMHEDGRKWNSNDSYLSDSKWNKYKELCYSFNAGVYCSLYCYKCNNYKILEYSDFDWSKQFTKSDLQDFDFVVTRDNEALCVNITLDTIITKDGICLKLCDYRDDLLSKVMLDLDIMEVYRPTTQLQCWFDSYLQGKLIYKREEPIEMTLEQICKELGRDIKIVR